MVFVVLMIVVLIGTTALAVDYGLLVADANRLQRAADSAALGGANLLLKSGTDATSITYDQYNAKNMAITLAARNGVTLTSDQVTFPAYNKIKVTPVFSQKYLFASILGFQRGSVIRSATAGRLPLKGVTGVVPLALTTDDYNANKGGAAIEYTLIRNQDTDFVPGTVASVDLRPDSSGKSGNVFQNDLQDGYSGTIYIGQKIDNALTADITSQGAKAETALADRISDAKLAPYQDTGSNYTYPNYPPDDRRIMMMIVADANPLSNNNPTLNARFFVPVYVESYRSPANKTEYIKFRILPSYTYNSQNPAIIIGDDTTPYSGVSVVAMTE
jgi:Flp pilus assembly protein TadG